MEKKKTAKRNKGAALVAAAMLAIAGSAVAGEKDRHIDYFDVKLSLHVPRVYSNEKSLGQRKYLTQTVVGEMLWHYSENGDLCDVTFTNFVNKTHKLSSGKNVTYKTTLDYDSKWPRFNLIGNNKTEKFKTPSVCFAIAAEPSYNIGELDEDNALYITMSGKGSIASPAGYVRILAGKVAGTIGCGCMAYGHVSPTRKIGIFGATDSVDDVAAVDGIWRAKLNKKKSLR